MFRKHLSQYITKASALVFVTFMHLADTFIQSDLQCIQVIYVLSVCVLPGNWTHDLCPANAMLYHWATGILSTLSALVSLFLVPIFCLSLLSEVLKPKLQLDEWACRSCIRIQTASNLHRATVRESAGSSTRWAIQAATAQKWWELLRVMTHIKYRPITFARSLFESVILQESCEWRVMTKLAGEYSAPSSLRARDDW